MRRRRSSLADALTTKEKREEVENLRVYELKAESEEEAKEWVAFTAHGNQNSSAIGKSYDGPGSAMFGGIKAGYIQKGALADSLPGRRDGSFLTSLLQGRDPLGGIKKSQVSMRGCKSALTTLRCDPSFGATRIRARSISSSSADACMHFDQKVLRCLHRGYLRFNLGALVSWKLRSHLPA